MERNIFWVGFMVISTVSAMPPNPFQQHISPCEKLTVQLAAWGLQGVISSPTANTALMLSPQGIGQRIKVDKELFPDVRIENVGMGYVVARVNPACKPSSYRWEIKGKTYAMDAGISSGVGSASLQPGW